MSLFKRESKNDRIERLMLENKKLEDQIGDLTAKLNKIQQDINTTPEDCRRGPYCTACEFAKYYNVIDYNTNCIIPTYVCGKVNACKNFVEKKER